VAADELPCEFVSTTDKDTSGFAPAGIVNGICSEKALPN
jgi:hypothetical protein